MARSEGEHLVSSTDVQHGKRAKEAINGQQKYKGLLG
jgi:hypothetical protein